MGIKQADGGFGLMERLGDLRDVLTVNLERIAEAANAVRKGRIDMRFSVDEQAVGEIDERMSRLISPDLVVAEPDGQKVDMNRLKD